jgi:TldD protein
LDYIHTFSHSGFGIRVLKNGVWGFAASNDFTPDEVVQTAKTAVAIADSARHLVRHEAALAPVEPAVATWESKPEIDPFEVKTEDKVTLLSEVDRLMKAATPVASTSGLLVSHREEKIFVSSEGSRISQSLVNTGAAIQAVARAQNDVQVRTYPVQSSGDGVLRGWEYIERLDLLGNAERVAKEACELTGAPQCPSGIFDVILGGSQLALQLHESCGHAVEYDRAIGMETGSIGTSYLTPDKRGSFRFGSPIVNVVADATIPGALGSFGYDDDGVPAQKVDIVKDGVFLNYLTSRETGAMLGEPSTGASRAMSADRIPLIRMTNVSLMPADYSLDEIIRTTKHGILMDVNKSFSIDDRRYHFQFGTEAGWEIEDGSVRRMVRNPIYAGDAPEFWNSCDAIAGKDEWRVYGLPSCGKGEPLQLVGVGHGASPARFRNVKVGVGKW